MIKKRILIVEDDKTIRSQLAEIFELEGFPVSTAENGVEALSVLHGLDELPGMIFLDLNMPIMDGQTFLSEIQMNPENARFNSIPVVIVSAARYEIYGTVVDYIRKPPQLMQLIDLAEKYAQT
jgi:CheY-like chemotaxis protein